MKTQSTPYLDFTKTCTRVGQTRSRLEKAAILGEYFESLPDRDLDHAARYFSGQVFSLSDQRKISVGPAAIRSALEKVTGASSDHVRESLVKHGDLGDVAAELMTEKKGPKITLEQVHSFFEALSKAKGSRAKTELLAGTLKPMGPSEGRYLIKILLGDLRIGLKEGSVEDALARSAGKKVGEIQWANMLTGNIGEVALMARHDRLREAKLHLFHCLKFMLASPIEKLDEIHAAMPGRFAVEDKFDGIRAQIHVAPAKDEDTYAHGLVNGEVRVAIFSRTLDEITSGFPELVDAFSEFYRAIPRSKKNSGMIFDGEIVPLKNGKILPFQELQKRLGRKNPGSEILAQVPVGYMVFDMLYDEGEILIEKPFSERSARLDRVPLNGGSIVRAHSQIFSKIDLLDAEFDKARARNNEGLMIKNLDSTYKPGRRGKDWLKVKRALAALDVVVTSVEVGSGRRRHLLSDFTFAVRGSEKDPTLYNIGKAYSGLTDQELEELSKWFREHTTQEFAHGKVRVVEPKVVVEITFDQVQESKRHKGGFALRFPRILRLRPDKPVDEIDTLETVRHIAEKGLDPREKEKKAAELFKGFLAGLEKKSRITVFHDFDADGVTAGVVLEKALLRAGYQHVARVITGRERSFRDPANLERIRATRPDALFVLDLGSQSEPMLEGVRSCYIDHHRPGGVGDGDTLISAYEWDPIPNTSLITYQLCQSIADMTGLDWIAAVGVISDLGERAPFEMLNQAKKTYKAKNLKEVTTLVNAIRRVQGFEPEMAAQALLKFSSPDELLKSTSIEVGAMRKARKELLVEMNEAKKAAPVFSGNVALVRIRSRAQVHPLLAQIWRTRLPKFMVIVANEDYFPGRVSFSARSGPGVNVLKFLNSIQLNLNDEAQGAFGHGHDQASGGSLSPDKWQEFLTKLGFTDEILNRKKRAA